MNINLDWISFQMRWMSFIATICVVIIHSRSYLLLPCPNSWVKGEQYFIADSLVRFSVQLFFVISGFWWSKNWKGSIISGYKTLIKKKIYSLLLPYLIWGLIGAILSLALTGINNIGTHRPFFARSVFEIRGIWPFLDSLLGILKIGPHGNMPLWFIRQLLIYFTIIPVISCILKGGVKFSSLCSFGIIFLNPYIPQNSWNPIMLNWIGWFVLGATIGQTRITELPFNKKIAILSGVIWSITSIISTLHLLHIGFDYSGIMQQHIISIIALFGIIFWWEMSFFLIRNRFLITSKKMFLYMSFIYIQRKH